MPPVSQTCLECSPPAYFLVGDKNPLHHLAKSLQDNIRACTTDVTWDLLPGKDHAGEWRALNGSAKVGEILDWLAKHPRNCPSPSEKGRSAIPQPASLPNALPTVRAPPSAKQGACTIAAPTAVRRDSWWIGLAVVIGVASRRRARRPRQVTALQRLVNLDH
jgi:hypothetical protein